MTGRHFVTHKINTSKMSRREIAAQVKKIAQKYGLNTQNIRLEDDTIVIPHISKSGRITDHVFVEV